ncbi:TPA: fimbrial protein [Escherichia coli]
MYRKIILAVIVCTSAAIQASASPSFPPPGMTLPEYWGEEDVWWHGRTSFKGQVIAPACTLAMEDRYQGIDMGSIAVRDLQGMHVGSEKKLRLRLRDCELAGVGRRIYTASRIRITFDGVQSNNSEYFAVYGNAEGIHLQIIDEQGYIARVGKPMPPLLLTGNEEGLTYTLRLIRNGKPLKPGDYYTVLRFKVDYE